MIDPESVLALLDEPLVAAVKARARRDAAFGRAIRVLDASACELPDAAATTAALLEPPQAGPWPQLGTLAPGSAVVVQVEASAEGRARYVGWLAEAAARGLPALALAPCSRDDAGLHRLWCVAAARLLLPDTVSIHARFDLLGIRLAQLALGFGADALVGPIAPDRTLPLCGVTRPDEATHAGLQTLVRHAGLQPAPSTEVTR
ncbi:MAG: hypothetical protein IPK74_19830 [Deltaproteobacteria bacterium]|nr:hypothetical protein [Deltaproteobacteria bacterium]